MLSNAERITNDGEETTITNKKHSLFSRRSSVIFMHGYATIAFMLYVLYAQGFLLVNYYQILPDDLGHHVANVSLVMELWVIGTSPMWGAVSDVMGRKVTLVFGWNLVAVGMLLTVSLKGLMVNYYIARSIMTIGFACLFTHMTILLTDFAEPSRYGVTAGMMGVFCGLGAVSGTYMLGSNVICYSILFLRASPTVLLPSAQLNKGCSFTCVNKMMRVTSHDGRHTIGYIEPKTHCLRIQFNAYDRKQKEIFQIHGNKFQLSNMIGKLPIKGFKRVVFDAVDHRGETLGSVANEWGGFFRELFGDADDYTIKFKSRMTAEDKLMLLATATYLDMRYFSSCCSFSVRDCIIKRYTPAPVIKSLKYAPVALQSAKAGGDQVRKKR